MNELIPMRDKILIVDLEQKEYKVGSIVIPNSDGKTHGVKPHWAKVYKVGEDIDYVTPGQWVLLKHGRWSRKMTVTLNEQEISFWSADPKSIEAITDEDPAGIIETVGDSYGSDYVKFR